MALLDTTKLLYTALGVGVIGGTGAGAYYFLSNSDSKESKTVDIAAKLSSEKYELLRDESDEWTNILNSYKTNKKFQFQGFDGNTPKTGAEERLKELCSQATKLDSSKDTNNAIYEKAKKWCTKPRTLTNILQDKGYKMLNTAADGDPVSEAWDTKLKSHQEATENVDKKFKDLVLDSTSSNKEQINRGKLREKCRGLKDKKHYEQEFEKELDQAMLWCSTKNQ